MSAADIAAYIGAAAWLPQIGVWLYGYFQKARARFLPDQTVEIGFTEFGPIFNVRLACFVESRDLIVEHFQIDVTHEDGEHRRFEWAQIGETFSQIQDASGLALQTVRRDQAPIAFKIPKVGYRELVFRFQTPPYRVADRQRLSALLDRLNHFVSVDEATAGAKTFESKEYFDLMEARKNWPSWKTGKYVAKIAIGSPEKFELQNSDFSFVVTKAHVELLEKNRGLLDRNIRLLLTNKPGDTPPPGTVFNWAYPDVERIVRSI